MIIVSPVQKTKRNSIQRNYMKKKWENIGQNATPFAKSIIITFVIISVILDINFVTNGRSSVASDFLIDK